MAIKNKKNNVEDGCSHSIGKSRYGKKKTPKIKNMEINEKKLFYERVT